MSTGPDPNPTESKVVSFDVMNLAGDVRPDDEGLFARDVDGQLIRVEKATASELDEDVTLTIDGRSVTVKKAVPTVTARGTSFAIATARRFLDRPPFTTRPARRSSKTPVTPIRSRPCATRSICHR